MSTTQESIFHYFLIEGPANGLTRLPLKDVDNITVTLAAVLLGHLLFK